jgi:hypothetical protein
LPRRGSAERRRRRHGLGTARLVDDEARMIGRKFDSTLRRSNRPDGSNKD